MMISNGDPLSARYNLYQKMKMGREGWWTETDIVTSMSCDETDFFVKSKMVVRENGKEVLSKEWDDKIPRVGL
jgi:hypothetical protein